MKLTNEPILVRAFLGALLGTLVTVAGVNLAPEAIESILTLSDATMALLPTLLALIGSLSAHSKVDGPVTAANKSARIERLQTVLEEQIAREQSSPSKKPPPDSAKRSTIASLVFLATTLLLLSGCAAFQSAKPALQTADSLAQQACAVFFGQQRGMSVEDAAEAFCEAKEQYQPWLDALLRTDRAVERSLPRGE